MPTLLLSKPTGRLSDKVLIKVLKQPEAWIALTSEQQQHIYSLLPPLHYPTADVPMEVDTTVHPMKHPVYREAIKQFAAHIEKQIENGADKKAWQDQARHATLKRADGAYDESKAADREEYWGQKAVPKLSTEQAGTATAVTENSEGL